MEHALLLLALLAAQAQARIICTDVDPDSTCRGTNDNCYLDLNNDGNSSGFDPPVHTGCQGSVFGVFVTR